MSENISNSEENRGNTNNDKSKHRTEFLFRMYDQLWNSINSHLLVIWQSIGVLISAFALFALIDKQIISIDLATTLIILICGWFFSNLYDASYWYNRNQAIVSNIEKQLLLREDLNNIHYYFGKHRKNDMIIHFQIQFALGIVVTVIFLLYYFQTRVLFHKLEPVMIMPCIATLMAIIYVCWVRKCLKDHYESLIVNSPGIEINTEGVDYTRPGH